MSGDPRRQQHDPARPDGPASPVALGPTTPVGDLHVTDPKQTAAGVTAVWSATRTVLREAGLRRGLPLLRDVNQAAGFDCPSCAWPDPAGERSFAEFCENGARAVADAGTRRTVPPAFFAQHSVAELAGWTDRDLNRAGRITHPMVRHGDDHFQPIDWDDAFALVGDRLRELSSPDRALFYTSGRASNEAAFLYQLFVRAFGTNNLPDCSNMCHESSGAALGSTIGIGKGTVLLEDFDQADVIVVVGQNPGTNHPRMLTALQHAREHGARIVSINPLRESGLVRVRNPQDFARPTRWHHAVRGTELAEVFLPVRIGGDLALLTGVQKALLERDRRGEPGIDRDFVASNTSGWDGLAAHLDAVSWEQIEREAGIDRARIDALAELLAGTNRIIWCWAMGLTQHEHAVDTIRQLVNLALLRGAIGLPGAGLCPVRGHSNVQGDRTVGIWDKPSADFLDRLAAGAGFDPPREHGLDVVEGIRAMHTGDIDLFVALGGNLLSAGPDTAYTEEALARTPMGVHIATKLNRSHLVGDGTVLLLPCLARTDLDIQASGEQFVTTENSMGIVQMSRGGMAPVADSLRSEPAIVAGLARATLGEHTPVNWQWLVDHYDRIRDLIEASIDGFDDYNRRVRAPGGFALPNHAREGDWSSLPDGRARLSVADIPTTSLQPGELVMMTIRSHDQFNTTIYDHDDRYRGIHDERRVVLLSQPDMAARGLQPGDLVDLVGRHGGVERRASNFRVVAYDLPIGNCATYFPEANVLVPIDRVARESNTPTSKYVVVTVEPAPGDGPSASGDDPAVSA
jgi:molybdopterin-dependent oxidoreductase alpha subunit